MHSFTGERAPLLKRDKAPVWGKPINLLSGKGIEGWHADRNNQWVNINGVLTSLKAAPILLLIKILKISNYILNSVIPEAIVVCI